MLVLPKRFDSLPRTIEPLHVPVRPNSHVGAHIQKPCVTCFVAELSNVGIDMPRGAVSVATRVVAILSDGLVVVLTWMKTYRVHVLTRGVDFRTNYSTLILRDGTVYFLSVLVCTFV